MGKGSEVEQAMPATGSELVAAGATLVRLENMTQMSLAIQRPRDEKQILEEALAELDLYPSLAPECIYNKPVGKDESGTMKYVEGLSIKAAQSLANRWNNSAYGCEEIAETDAKATLAAVFLDMERNTRRVLQADVSKYYTTKHKQVMLLTPERFANAKKAEQSKLLREVILRSLPGGLVKEYELKARKVMAGEKLPARRKSMVEKFAGLGVEVGLLEVKMGKMITSASHDDINQMIGIYNSLKDGETTLKEVFGVDPTVRNTAAPEPQQGTLIPKGGNSQ